MLDFNQWTVKNTWIAKMNASKGLDSFDNYGGARDFEGHDWIVSVGRNRDSDIMAESNFQSALEMLGGESKDVKVERFGHWGCGWFELILVNPKAKRKAKKAYEIAIALENYPILDESDYSERENEYQSEYAEGAKEDLAEALAKHFGVKNGKALVDLAYSLNMECQSYYGNDACINIYDCRKPDKHDVERLKTVLGEIQDREKSKVYKDLVNKLANYKVEE